jgi:hypothetical protein
MSDAKRSRSILNGTVDLHVQAADHHRNIAGIGIQHPLMSPESDDGIRPHSPESGQPDSGDQSDRNPAIWPDLARPAGFRPSDRIWPERPESGHRAGSGQRAGSRSDLAREAGSRPALARTAGWQDGSDQTRPDGRKPAFCARIRRNCRNPAIPDSDETVRIPAFFSNSSYVSRNQVKIVRI